MNAPYRAGGKEEGKIAHITAALNDAVRRAERGRDGLTDQAFMNPAGLARRYLRQRLARYAMFPADIFGEPAWDILLDLYVASVDQREVATSSACIAAAVPSTTALRWVDKLVAMGLVLRVDDPNDRRRTLLRLPRDVAEKIEKWIVATWPVGSDTDEFAVSLRR